MVKKDFEKIKVWRNPGAVALRAVVGRTKGWSAPHTFSWSLTHRRPPTTSWGRESTTFSPASREHWLPLSDREGQPQNNKPSKVAKMASWSGFSVIMLISWAGLGWASIQSAHQLQVGDRGLKFQRKSALALPALRLNQNSLLCAPPPPTPGTVPRENYPCNQSHPVTFFFTDFPEGEAILLQFCLISKLSHFFVS